MCMLYSRFHCRLSVSANSRSCARELCLFASGPIFKDQDKSGPVTHAVICKTVRITYTGICNMDPVTDVLLHFYICKTGQKVKQ